MSSTSHTELQLAPRQSQDLVWRGIIWWPGYERTLGLTAFRKKERYAVWMHAHRRLTLSVPGYATATCWFWVMCGLCATVVTVWWWLSGLLAAPATLGLACGTLLYYREQHRRNVAIAQLIS